MGATVCPLLKCPTTTAPLRPAELLLAEQVLFGFGIASEIIFSGYVFAFVGASRFQTVTSLTQASRHPPTAT